MLKYLCTFCLMLVSISSFSQGPTPQSKTTSNTRIDVLTVYEDVVAQGYESAQVYRKLANGRFFERNYTEAKKWYAKLFEMDDKPEPIEYLRYSETLAALEEHELAANYKKRYEEAKGPK